jgi:hypothetical protein
MTQPRPRFAPSGATYRPAHGSVVSGARTMQQRSCLTPRVGVTASCRDRCIGLGVPTLVLAQWRRDR